jgi:hypothetical protein
VDARNPDGTASGYENDNYGINLNGGSTLNHKNVICTNNIVIGHGILGNVNSGAIQAVFVQNANLSGNIMQKWGGSCINATGSSAIIINNNTFLELGGAYSGAENAIMMDVVSSLGYTFTIANNSIQSNGGTPADVGVRAALITTLPLFSGNDFLAATSGGYVVASPFSISDSGLPSFNATVNNAGTGQTINVSSMSRYSDFVINVSSSNALSTITNLTNAAEGQRVTLYSPGATAWEFTRNNARLNASTNFSATQYDSLVIYLPATEWIEISRSANG